MRRAILALCCAPLWAQTTGNQIIIPSPGPRPVSPTPNVQVNCTVSCNTTANYYVVAHYPVGSGPVSNAAQVVRSGDRGTTGNQNVITWTAATGATGYDVITSTAPQAPTPGATGNYAVSGCVNITATTCTDTVSASPVSYTVPIPAPTAQCIITNNNIDYVVPTFTFSCPMVIPPGSTGGAGGAQTPWTSNINGGGFALTNTSNVQVGTSTGSMFNLVPTGPCWENNNINRWCEFLQNNETGNNVGSDLILQNYSDTGTALPSLITFKRQNGFVGIGGQAPTAQLYVTEATPTSVSSGNGTPAGNLLVTSGGQGGACTGASCVGGSGAQISLVTFGGGNGTSTGGNGGTISLSTGGGGFPGGNGGDLGISTSGGGGSNTGSSPGASGNINLTAGTGGTNSGGTGGTGGGVNISSGTGGVNNIGSQAGGTGGTIALLAGAGGNNADVGSSGNGGNIVITSGVPGAQFGSTRGTPGTIQVNQGSSNPVYQVSTSGAITFNAGASNAGTTVIGGADTGTTGPTGLLILRGADQFGAVATNTAAGGVLIRGGRNASTTLTSQSGGIQMFPGWSYINASSAGLMGLFGVGSTYFTSGGVTNTALVCMGASPMTVLNCPTGSQTVMGIAQFTTTQSGTTIASVVTVPGAVTLLAMDNAPVLGHTVCVSASLAGSGSDSGGTNLCTTGPTIGTVVDATNGRIYKAPDGNQFTISTSSPFKGLVQLTNLINIGARMVFNGNVSVNNATFTANTCTTATSFAIAILRADNSQSVTLTPAGSGADPNTSFFGKGLTFNWWVTPGNFNWSVCNNTAASITTPGPYSQALIVTQQ